MFYTYRLNFLNAFMHFHSYGSLRVFTIAAQKLSLTEAATTLHLTKGAVSYQIKQLEQELGFAVFNRQGGGITLTEKGARLQQVAQAAFEQVEEEIERIRQQDNLRITIGMTTYFASRWLSPRLMGFTHQHQNIGFRLQPTIGRIDLSHEGIDMEIRWGNGQWNDLEIEPLFECPVLATAGTSSMKNIEGAELQEAISGATLLHDFEGSTAWRDWHQAAGIEYQSKQDGLVIADPNVRVQSVIDKQGLALNDELVSPELQSNLLFQVSNVRLSNYGYFLAYPKEAMSNKSLQHFRDWIVDEAAEWNNK